MTGSLIPSRIRDSSPQWFLSPPIVSQDITILNVSTESGVSIIGVELTSGKKLWERPLSQYPACYWSPGAVLEPGDEFLFIEDGAAITTELRTGLESGRFELEGIHSNSSPIAIHAGIAFVADTARGMNAISIADKKILWAVDDDRRITYAPPVLAERTLAYAICNQPTLVKMVRMDGTLLWERSLDRQQTGSCATDGHRLYLRFAGRVSTRLVSLDLTTGRTVWDEESKNRYGELIDPSSLQGGVALANGTVFSLSGDRVVEARNCADGSIKWEVEISAECSCAPMLAGGKVIAGGENGIVAVLDKESGSILQELEIGDLIRFTPIATPDAVVITAQESLWTLTGFDI